MASTASFWLPLHLALGVVSYGLFGIAVVHAWLLSRTEARLRLAANPHSGLPLLTLERLTYRFVLAGFILLSATLLIGYGFGDVVYGHGHAWRWNHKSIFSLLSWCTFATLLAGRHGLSADVARTKYGINPFFTNNAGEATLREIDSEGYLLQGSYTFGKNRVALSYGKTEDDGNGLGTAADYETRGVALFHDINDNLKLVAEYNQFEINGHDTSAQNEDTDTFAVGAVLTW